MTLLNKQASDSFGGSDGSAHTRFMASNKFSLLTFVGKTT